MLAQLDDDVLEVDEKVVRELPQLADGFHEAVVVVLQLLDQLHRLGISVDVGNFLEIVI